MFCIEGIERITYFLSLLACHSKLDLGSISTRVIFRFWFIKLQIIWIPDQVWDDSGNI